AWNSNINEMTDFANNRPSYQRTHIRNHFGISHYITLTADINIKAAGKIRVNTITIEPETPGVDPDPYPWQGLYFAGIPIEIEAIAAPGYKFSHWEGYDNSNQPIININSSGLVSLKAHFTQIDESVLAHYWHFNALDGVVTQVPSDYSATGSPVITYPGGGEGYMDERTHRDEDPVSNLNLQMDQQANQGAVLRARNPSDSRALIIETPSTGFRDLQFTYATTSTSNGARQQILYYSTNGGSTWVEALPEYNVPQLPFWELKSVDLSDVAGANNNPNLKFRVFFRGENAALTAGNNRFDNITLFGTPLTTQTESITDQQEILTVYPNPATDFIILENKQYPAGSMINLQVISLDGMVVLDMPAVSSGRINISHLRSGLYIIKATTTNEIFTQKLMIR
ncbi:MAG: T9SS type A sorting domain-containing protein, partial [Bacteroidota bacterium]